MKEASRRTILFVVPDHCLLTLQVMSLQSRYVRFSVSSVSWGGGEGVAKVCNFLKEVTRFGGSFRALILQILLTMLEEEVNKETS